MNTKKIIKLVLVTFLFFGYSQVSHAQIWKKIKQKAKEKVSNTEDKILNKIDGKVDKTIDKTIEGDPNTKTDKKRKASKEVPKFIGGPGVLTLYNHGYEYSRNDFSVSVYGKFTKTNLSSSQKTYNQDRVIAPVDAYPPGYALVYNTGGYLYQKAGQIIIHHADSTKIVFSLKGNWYNYDTYQLVSASYISVNVSKIDDKRVDEDTPVDYEKEEELERARQKEITDAFPTNTNANTTSVTLPSSFSFTSSLEVKITTSSEKDLNMEFLLGSNPDIYAMSLASAEMGDRGQIYNVFTPQSMTMFMNVSGMKMKKSMAQQPSTPMNFKDKMPTNPGDIKKTGATKSILGFTCYEYKFTNNGSSVSIWATKDFPAKHVNITMLGMQKGGLVDGFVLEIDMKSSEGSSNMKAVKYNKNKSVTINTSEYKSMGY